MKSTKYYQYGNPLKAIFSKHYCISCGNLLKKRKHSRTINSQSAEAKYFDFSCGESNHIKGDCRFIHNVFFCEKCGKEIEYITQFSLENNTKRIQKIYNKLLKLVKTEQTKKIWIDKCDNILEGEPNLSEMKKIMFLIKLKKEEFFIPCSIIEKTYYWERPIRIKKDRRFRRAFKILKSKLNN